MKRLLLYFSLSVCLGFTLSLIGCGATARHVAVNVDATLFEVVSDIHAEEQGALCGLPSCAGSSVTEHLSGWTLAKSQSFNKKLLPVAEAGRQFNQLLAGWKPGQPVPQAVTDAVNGIAGALSAVAADFPAGATRTAVLADLGQAQAVLLNAFQIVLIVKGA